MGQEVGKSSSRGVKEVRDLSNRRAALYECTSANPTKEKAPAITIATSFNSLNISPNPLRFTSSKLEEKECFLWQKATLWDATWAGAEGSVHSRRAWLQMGTRKIPCIDTLCPQIHLSACLILNIWRFNALTWPSSQHKAARSLHPSMRAIMIDTQDFMPRYYRFHHIRLHLGANFRSASRFEKPIVTILELKRQIQG